MARLYPQSTSGQSDYHQAYFCFVQIVSKARENCNTCQGRSTHNECHISWAGPAASCSVCPDQRGSTWPVSPDETGSPTASVPFSLLCGSLWWYGAYQLEKLGIELASLGCFRLPTRCLLGNHLEETGEGTVIQAHLHSYTVLIQRLNAQPLRYFM